MTWSDAPQGLAPVIAAAVAALLAMITSGARLVRRHRLARHLDRDLGLLERMPELPAKPDLEAAVSRQAGQLAHEIDRGLEWVPARFYASMGLFFLVGGFVYPSMTQDSDVDWYRRSSIVIGLALMGLGALMLLGSSVVLGLRWLYDREDEQRQLRTRQFILRLIGRARPTTTSAGRDDELV